MRALKYPPFLIWIGTLLGLSLMSLAQTTVQVPYSGNVTITIPTGCTLSGTTVTCSPGPPPGPRTKLTPNGGNDQPAVYAAAAKGPVELGCPSSAPCTFKLATSTLPTGADIWFDDGVTVTDYSAYSGFAHMFALSGLSNVKLTGSGSPSAALLTMPLTWSKNFGASGFPVNMCIWVETSSNVTISGLAFDRCGGDSIYIGKDSSNVTINNVRSTDPVRNGCSITDQVTSILVENSIFSGAKNKAAGIMDGCDVEPNGTGPASPLPGQFVKGVTFLNDTFSNNGGSPICICLYFINSTTPIAINLTGNQSVNNFLPAFMKSNWPKTINGSIAGSANTVNGVLVTFP